MPQRQTAFAFFLGCFAVYLDVTGDGASAMLLFRAADGGLVRL